MYTIPEFNTLTVTGTLKSVAINYFRFDVKEKITWYPVFHASDI